MKKMFLPILAVVFAGSFTDIDNAFNAFIPGSGASAQLKEEITETGTVAQFVDIDGNVQTLNEGDAAVGVTDEDGIHTGFRRADKSEVSKWLLGVPADEPTAPAEAATAANTDLEKQDEDNANTGTGNAE